MKPTVILATLLSFWCGRAAAQTDTAALKNIFERLTAEAKSYRVDTSAVSEDKTTRKIRELRALRGGFNITEAVQYKLLEEEQKGEMPKATLEKLKAQFTNGDAARWLENAVIHIYRDQFTYAELKQLVKFYRTPAGQKLADAFPSILLKTAAAAQTIQEAVMKSIGP